MTTARLRFRDVIRSFVTPWLSDRGQSVQTATVGFRYIWAMVAPLDAAADVLLQGIRAAWPGAGTPTALSLIGRSRGIVRGVGESDASYAARQIPWLDRHRIAGSQEAVALSLHEFLEGRPRVRVINRAGHRVTVDLDGTMTRDVIAWDWDSVSHPERATHWWDQWIIIDPCPWPIDGVWGADELWGGGLGFGHDATREDADTVLAIIRQFKAEQTFVRAIIWSYDATLFDPDAPSTMPDGTWGAWSLRSGGAVVPSGRNPDCRYWEVSRW